jgi:hypothetical protein
VGNPWLRQMRRRRDVRSGSKADIAKKLMPFICSNSRFSLAQKSRIESRITSPGNRTLGGG